ncbi:MAG: carboxypeptidase M32 [Candidatus Eisenbacteria sp.]|nr:carboxypeptidase M32 [Candidatus Eisenbacteria bacterium]
MTARTAQAYAEFLELTKEIFYLQSAAGILGWDQQTMMPPGAAPLRGRQSSTLTGIIHDRLTSSRLAELIGELRENAAALDPNAQVNAREMQRVTERARKIPRDLAQRISETQILSQQSWIEAKQKSDFDLFAPWLEKMLALRREEADAVGYEESRLDALLEDYEPYATASQISEVFSALRPPLVELVQAIRESGVTPRREIVRRRFPPERQKEFGLWAIRKFGFDFNIGRVDVSAHPMTVGNTTDVRLTTRFDEEYLPMSLFGLVHEAGHGMYEQGFEVDHQGTPRAMAVSLGIHESQSRMWENLVARSLSFWKYAFPYLQAFFPEQTRDVSLEEWYAAVNDVRPSLIRVEADEVTYNLHVILRFEIEKELVEDRIKIADLPALWNQRFQDYLGIVPENDARGVLQDIHWSIGLVGYFPTYALGNLYAAQFFNTAQKEIPDLHERFAAGEFLTLREWLRTKIHAPGQTYRAGELVERVTGEPLDAKYLLTHLRQKFGSLYGNCC